MTRYIVRVQAAGWFNIDSQDDIGTVQDKLLTWSEEEIVEAAQVELLTYQVERQED